MVECRGLGVDGIGDHRRRAGGLLHQGPLVAQGIVVGILAGSAGECHGGAGFQGVVQALVGTGIGHWNSVEHGEHHRGRQAGIESVADDQLGGETAVNFGIPNVAKRTLSFFPAQSLTGVDDSHAILRRWPNTTAVIISYSRTRNWWKTWYAISYRKIGCNIWTLPACSGSTPSFIPKPWSSATEI